jgi:hypothetical protein
MARQKGTTKTGGRKKGSLNRATRNLVEFFEKIDFNLPEEVIKLLPELSPKERANLYLKLMEFIYPKRKAQEIELSGQEQNPVSIQVNFVSPEDKELPIITDSD